MGTLNDILSKAQQRAHENGLPYAGSLTPAEAQQLRDNLESRLILLRKRLDEKCPQIKMMATGRGKFELTIAGPYELVERD